MREMLYERATQKAQNDKNSKCMQEIDNANWGGRKFTKIDEKSMILLIHKDHNFLKE